MDFAHVYGLVASLLEREGRRVAVVGGLGLAGHGVIRATVDLDLITEAAAQDTLVRFLEAEGYETLYRSAGYSNHLHAKADLGRVDFVYVDGPTADKIFGGSLPRLDLGERRALVPRAEHLVAMKVQAMKNDPTRELQDLADIQSLLRLPGIDFDEIQRYFEKAGLLERYHVLRRSL